VQLVCPGFADIWPAGQGVQGTTEVFENVPARQAVAQLVDAVEPRGEDFPAGHLVHWADFARDHSPKSHVVHDFDPATEYVPAGQVPQGAMPESENMPPGQTGMHADAPASDEKPTGHFEHVLELAFE
jgi:hypothetical protein